jgi:transcription elongation factor GreA
MKLEGLFLSKEKKKELENELKQLETKGRKDAAERLEGAREALLSEDDEDLIMAVEEKQRLEDRITEIRDLLWRARVTKEECKIVADIGSEVVLVANKDVRVFRLVSPVEVEPEKNKISTDSPIGKLIKGLRVSDKVKIDDIEYKVLYIC